jgi:putative membrane protein
MSQQFVFFLIRWVFNSLGLWVAARIFNGHGVTYDESQSLAVFLLLGLVLSVANVILKPILVILSLPAILLTLGLFTFIVNGLMVYLAGKLVPGFNITFWTAVLAGMIVSLINYVLTNLVDTTAAAQGNKKA